MNPQNNPNTNAATAPATTTRSSRGKNQDKKEKVKISYIIKPEQFQTKKGIHALYEMTKALKLDQQSEINIENTMKKIVAVLKTWQFEFAPKYSFDYFLQRCQVLGSHKLVTAYMSKVRKIHKGEEQWEEAEPVIGQQQGNQMQEGNANSHLEHDLNILSGRPQGNMEQIDPNDEEMLELMYGTGKRENRHDDKMEEQEEHYIPEGFEQAFPFDDDDQ